MSSSSILYSVQGGVATVTLNRPDVLNSFDGEMARQLQQRLDESAGDAQVRAVLITGAGRAFCAGQDLSSVPLDSADGPLDLGNVVRERWNPIIQRIRDLEKPVVAAVNGVAAGAGANLALACDIVIASTSASFIQAFSKIGIIPDSGGTFFLPRLVGFARASALTMLGEKISATQARDWGMIWQVYAPEELEGATKTLLDSLAAMATRGLGLTKRALNASMHNDVSGQLAVEESLQRDAGKTRDFREGVQSFLEKRKAEFTGQ
ncbi:MAG: 2-(1,2-epoxy-1,2-dihydrophenyl)acetyl-CoA isomerase PaaG [Gemmatimonadaceae bacterium]